MNNTALCSSTTTPPLETSSSVPSHTVVLSSNPSPSLIMETSPLRRTRWWQCPPSPPSCTGSAHQLLKTNKGNPLTTVIVCGLQVPVWRTRPDPDVVQQLEEKLKKTVERMEHSTWTFLTTKYRRCRNNRSYRWQQAEQVSQSDLREGIGFTGLKLTNKGRLHFSHISCDIKLSAEKHVRRLALPHGDI